MRIFLKFSKKMTLGPKFIVCQKKTYFHKKRDLENLKKSLFEEKKPPAGIYHSSKMFVFLKSHFLRRKKRPLRARPRKHNACVGDLVFLEKNRPILEICLLWQKKSPDICENRRKSLKISEKYWKSLKMNLRSFKMIEYIVYYIILYIILFILFI